MKTTEFYLMTVGYLPKHRRIQKMCGTYAAAKMLKTRGYSLQQTLNLLALKG